MSRRAGTYDPDDWYNRWQATHGSAHFPGHLSDLILSTLQDQRTPDGAGLRRLSYEEDDGRWIVVEVNYLVETFVDGRVFHILSLSSPGDPPGDDT